MSCINAYNNTVSCLVHQETKFRILKVVVNDDMFGLETLRVEGEALSGSLFDM